LKTTFSSLHASCIKQAFLKAMNERMACSGYSGLMHGIRTQHDVMHSSKPACIKSKGLHPKEIRYAHCLFRWQLAEQCCWCATQSGVLAHITQTVLLVGYTIGYAHIPHAVGFPTDKAKACTFSDRHASRCCWVVAQFARDPACFTVE